MFDFKNFYDFIASNLQTDSRMIEVGSADGKSGIYLAEAMANMNKGFDLRMVDNLDYGKENQLQEIMRNIQKSGLADKIQFYPFDSLNCSCKFPDEYFHFIFLDSSHSYELTKAEIRLWKKKLIPGGFFGGHDYFSHEGVRTAVNEVIPAEFIRTMATENGNGIWYILNENGFYVN